MEYCVYLDGEKINGVIGFSKNMKTDVKEIYSPSGNTYSVIGGNKLDGWNVKIETCDKRENLWGSTGGSRLIAKLQKLLSSRSYVRFRENNQSKSQRVVVTSLALTEQFDGVWIVDIGLTKYSGATVSLTTVPVVERAGKAVETVVTTAKTLYTGFGNAGLVGIATKPTVQLPSGEKVSNIAGLKADDKVVVTTTPNYIKYSDIAMDYNSAFVTEQQRENMAVNNMFTQLEESYSQTFSD